jgi:hypothetical protein
VRLGAEPATRLRLPEAAISIEAAITMRATFAENSSAVRALFDALAELLTGGEHRH